MKPGEITKYKKYLALLQNIWQQREDVKAYTGLLLSLVAVAFFSWFTIRPTVATILELRGQIKAQEKVLAILTQKQENLGVARRNWQALQDSLPIINQAIPKDPQPEDFARQVEALARKEGVTLSTLSVGEINILGGDKKLGMNTFEGIMVVEGRAGAIFSFLENISQVRRPLIWKNLRISAKTPGGATDLNLSVSGLVPYELK